VRNTLIYILIVVAALVAIGAIGVWLDLGPVGHSVAG
jgi:hypothetical protein